MASTLSTPCFVRCTKCLSVLAESPDIPLFKCYVCDSILKTKSHSDHSSYSKSEDSISNGGRIFRKSESSVNVMKTLSVSDNLNQKVRKSANYSFNSSHKLEKQSPESLEDNVKNMEGDEELRNGIGFKWKGRNSHTFDRSFSLSCPKHLPESIRTRSSQSYDRSFSLSSPRHPQTNLALSRRTPSRKGLVSADAIEAAGRDNNVNVEEQHVAEKHCSEFSIQSNEQNASASSEKLELSLIPRSSDEEQVLNFCFPETDDQLKIMEKVEELKIELHRMFSNKSAGREASSFTIKVTHLEGKIESDDNRSSPFRFSRPPSDTGFSCNGSRKLCQESQTRHCRPVSGGAPFVICYKCYRLLQLPADFLVSTKSIHRLRCGSCSEVLVYSFRPRPRAKINRRLLKQQSRWP